MDVIRELKPERILIVYRWFSKWNQKDQHIWGNYDEMASYFEDAMVKFDPVLREIKALGTEVYFTGIKPQGE
jgi:hypothetical protein